MGPDRSLIAALALSLLYAEPESAKDKPPRLEMGPPPGNEPICGLGAIMPNAKTERQPGPLPLLAPADGDAIASATPTFRWLEGVGNYRWHLTVFAGAQGVKDKNQVFHERDLVAISLRIPRDQALLPGTYCWIVVGESDMGYEDSEARVFTVYPKPDADELPAFLKAWSEREPRTDFDADSDIDVQDLFVFLNAWFAGCP